MSDQQLVAISASHRDPAPGARWVADIPPDEPIQFSIVVCRKVGGEDEPLRAAASEPSEPTSERRRRLTEEAGADQTDLDRVTKYVTDAGMLVESADAATRTVAVRGTTGPHCWSSCVRRVERRIPGRDDLQSVTPGGGWCLR